jgi:hypothetical protein
MQKSPAPQLEISVSIDRDLTANQLHWHMPLHLPATEETGLRSITRAFSSIVVSNIMIIIITTTTTTTTTTTSSSSSSSSSGIVIATGSPLVQCACFASCFGSLRALPPLHPLVRLNPCTADITAAKDANDAGAGIAGVKATA